jgi:DNA-binding CsgD family transcriptional regulator
MDTKSRVATLTKRQREIIRLTSLGCTATEIGAILKLSPATVDNHKTRSMRLLGVGRAPLLTRIAIKHGISPLGDQLTLAEKRRCGRKRDGWN